jgi:hypothetical protein
MCVRRGSRSGLQPLGGGSRRIALKKKAPGWGILHRSNVASFISELHPELLLPTPSTSGGQILLVVIYPVVVPE